MESAKVKRLDVPAKAQAVADALRVLVSTEKLLPGDKLPSEAELVEMLGVGRSSVREGIQLLESAGIVTVEQGRGMFLAKAPTSALVPVIEWSYPSGDDGERARLFDDLVEARLLVEPAQARLAAERATDDELEKLITGYRHEHAPEGLSLVETERYGQSYHDYIAEIAHNDVLRIMSSSLRPLYRELVRELSRPVEAMEAIVSGHGPITDAIAARDAASAEREMIAHLLEVNSVFRAWFEQSSAPRRKR